jgi:hypothetical protein
MEKDRNATMNVHATLTVKLETHWIWKEDGVKCNSHVLESKLISMEEKGFYAL